MMKKLTIICIAFLFGVTLSAQDTQWRGPGRDGKYPGTNLLKSWPAEGPELLLKKEGLGGGYSTPVIYNGVIYVSGRRDTTEVVTALNMQGDILWETAYGSAWMESFQETRNTPAIEDGRLYITGAKGTVCCMDAVTGTILWTRNTHTEFDASFGRWGMAESVLLTKNAVISSPTGPETTVVALDKKDGSLLWESESIGDERAYVSPLLINHNGREILLAVTSAHIVGLDPSDGKMIWKFDLVKDLTDRGRRINTNTPLYHHGEIFVTSGYNDKAVMLSLSEDGNSVSLKYSNDVLDCHHGGVVLVDGYVYGSNWINNGNGNWVCMKWDTGEIMYETEWNNKGSIIYADGKLYVFEEKRGNVGLVEPTPQGFNVISAFRIEEGKGPYWAHPSIYDGKLLLRHTDILFVYDIAE